MFDWGNLVKIDCVSILCLNVFPSKSPWVSKDCIKNIYVGCIDFWYINMPCVKGNCHPANDCMIHPLWCIEWREVWILSYVVLLAWLGSINYLVWMRWEGNWITWECVSTYVNGIVAFNSKCPWKEGVNEAQIIY